MSEQITVYVSKYAIGAKGRISRDVIEDRGDGYVRHGGGWNLLKIGRDCFYTEAEALAAAETARMKKLDSLRKQIRKLEGLSFRVAEPRP